MTPASKPEKVDMIEFDKVKAVNNVPNIIMRSGDKWTNLAQKKGMKYKGIEYLVCTWSTEDEIDDYWDAMRYGGKDFWTKKDSFNAMHYHEPKIKREIREWLKSERHKDSVLGR
jgi:cellulase/cellobiase CelA1